jgi:NitT/TauT family transport system ATP-binding protein
MGQLARQDEAADKPINGGSTSRGAGSDAVGGGISDDAARSGGSVQMPLVDVVAADLYYGEDEEGVLALQGTSIAIRRGEFAAVVGPSGCGKSTLLKLISGLGRASAGRVVVAGANVTAPLKIVGMAFQNPALLPWRTTLANLLLPLEIVSPHRQRIRRSQQRHIYVETARKLLDEVGLRGMETRFPWQLSGGMQQRVSLCRALIHNPEILLLDEPFGALDAFTREELWDVLQRLWLEQHFTVLLVTHDLTEAAYLADTIHVMSKRPGRVIFSTRIDLPRPRTAEMRYQPNFIDKVHELRRHIGRAREAS